MRHGTLLGIPTEYNLRSQITILFTLSVSLFLFSLFFEWIAPDVIPFTLFQFWMLNTSIEQLLISSWPLFAWGIGINALYSILTRNKPDFNRGAESFLFTGIKRSIVAGIAEEYIFRWLFFYAFIVTLQFSNFLFFGFLGFGIPEWFYLNIAGPVANFFTLGMLEPYLFNNLGWFVGAAIITSNGKFRDGHSYQGLLGLVNSWFLGMFFFYLMFEYGIIAPIVVHFLYNLFIFAIRYIDASVERMLGWV